jgi:hypothetical protein
LRLSIIETWYVQLITRKYFDENILLARTSRIDEVSSDYSQRRLYSSTDIIDEKSPRYGQNDFQGH